MPRDVQHLELKYKSSEIEHKYGDKVHILSNPYLQSILAKLARPDIFQPDVNYLIGQLYNQLLIEVLNGLFPRVNVTWDTRMKSIQKEGEFVGEVIHRDTYTVVVDLARAGTWPGHVCFPRGTRCSRSWKVYSGAWTRHTW